MVKSIANIRRQPRLTFNFKANQPTRVPRERWPVFSVLTSKGMVSVQSSVPFPAGRRGGREEGEREKEKEGRGKKTTNFKAEEYHKFNLI